MVQKLFFKLLPVQMMIVAMGAINSVVDGAVAGRSINAGVVGVVGLYYSMVCVIQAVGSVMLGGSSVQCGKYMGSGDLPRTNGVFSLNLTVTTLAGLILTIGSFLFASPLASLLGASDSLHPALMLYIRGYAIGIVPMLLSQQLSSFLQLERQNTRSMCGVIGMIISNIVLDLLLVTVFHLGVWGLALATSISNWVFFLIMVPYYFKKQAQLRYSWKQAAFHELPMIIKVGLPGAMTVLCMALRGIALNRILLRYAGEDGLSAHSAFNMLTGFILAYTLGSGAVVRMLTSVFVGEEDRDSIRALARVIATKVFPLSLLVTAAVLVLSGPASAIFFPDTASNVFRLCRQLLLVYAFCVPLVLFCIVCNNYLQATGHRLFVNVFSVLDGFVFIVIPAAILAPFFGVYGVWAAYPIGLVLTALLVPLYARIYWKRIPKTKDEWLFLPPDFGLSEEDRLDLHLHELGEVSTTAERVQAFCDAHDLDKKKSYYAALCVEEMIWNVVKHGFQGGTKKHEVIARVLCMKDEIRLRLKDDGIPFNPKERADMLSDEDVTKNIGLRVVSRLADEMNYQNLLGLNVLTIRIRV